MMHYRKGENVEREITREDLPFADCMPKGQKDFLWMHVKGGTKVHNVIAYAKNALDKNEYRSIVWSGSGGGVVKTISCAEILKRSYPLYQVTRMCYTTIEEHWFPQMDGLEEIVANRQIPCLHILMSLDAIDENVAGLQKPNTTTDYWIHDSSKNSASSTAPQRRDGQKHPRTGQNQRNRQKQSTPQQNKQNSRPEEQMQNETAEGDQENTSNTKKSKFPYKSFHSHRQKQQQLQKNLSQKDANVKSTKETPTPMES